MTPRIVIGISFGDGKTKEYALSDTLAKRFCNGEAITIEMENSAEREIFIAKLLKRK